MAQEVARRLKTTLTQVEDKHFADGEIYIRIKNKVRGNDVYLISSMAPPVNDSLMESLIVIDALRRASAGRINFICPYLGYSRQDRKVVSREAITAKLVANLITKSGADRLVTVDLHADQIQGFYDIPVDHFVAYPLFAKYLKKKNDFKDVVIVSPDIGGTKRANKMADLLGLNMAIIDKTRRSHNEAEVVAVVGEVKRKRVVLIDDIIDTGGSTTILAAEAVLKAGAKEVIAVATHAVFSHQATEKLQKSPITKVLVSDSLPMSEEKKFEKLEIISLASLLAKIVKRISGERSLGELFVWDKKKQEL